MKHVSLYWFYFFTKDVIVILLSVNYNEELSGLYGGVLLQQTKYASSCIAKILSLYKNNRYTKSVPNSVILIGHSMVSLLHIFIINNGLC